MGHRCSRAQNMEEIQSTIQQTIATPGVLPIGTPRKRSASSVPSKINNSYTVSTHSICDSTTSESFNSEHSECGAYDYSLKIAKGSRCRTESFVSSPLSLVELCMRRLCDFVCDWVDEEGDSKVNLEILPPSIIMLLFKMVKTHKLLGKSTLAVFRGCELFEMNLSQYAGVADDWLSEISLISHLRVLDLSHCIHLTDSGFYLLHKLQHVTSLNIECCTNLSDASVAYVVHSMMKLLQQLNISGCCSLTDITLSQVILCRKLKILELNRCQRMTSAYLCLIGRLVELEFLDVGLIPNVNDAVLLALENAHDLSNIEGAVSGLHTRGAKLVTYYKKRQLRDLENTPNNNKRAFTKNKAVQNLPFEIASSHIDTDLNLFLGFKSNGPSEQTGGLSKLKHLNISYCSVTDLGCLSLGKMSNLVYLDMTSNRVSSIAVDSLKMLIQMRHLNMSRCESIGDQAGVLASLPHIEYLNLERVPVSRFTCGFSISLRELNLSYTLVNDPTIDDICRQVPSLLVLKLGGCSISQGGILSLAMLSHLQVLDLNDTQTSGVAALSRLKSLRYLDLFQCKLGGKVSASIGTLTNLEWLCLDSADLNDRHLLCLSKCTRLKHLDLFGAKVTDQGLNYLARSGIETLETLEVCGGLVTDAGIVHLTHLPSKLRRINLSQNNSITDRGVQVLAAAYGLCLKSLGLSFTSLTKHSVTLFYSFAFLEELFVRQCSLPASDLADLQNTLPNLVSILQ